METDLAPIVEVLDENNKNTSDHDSSLPSAGNISRNVSHRASMFRRFLAFFCCSATPVSISRCSIDEDYVSDIYITANELTHDRFLLSPSSRLSIESAFPPQISAD
ncbi:unnamed protein product [Brassica rapa]|uniref:Uncharacterized protein n=1 Tax=Brassica campestris TaxID=3711 RepID=A0A8D9CNI2_BRACM|nr:unnamed protein product [Brassica rapa]